MGLNKTPLEPRKKSTRLNQDKKPPIEPQSKRIFKKGKTSDAKIKRQTQGKFIQPFGAHSSKLPTIPRLTQWFAPYRLARTFCQWEVV